MTISPAAPQFGGTIYFKVDNKAKAEELSDAMWDTVVGDEYGFVPDDKKMLLTEDVYCSTLKHYNGDKPGVVYLSAENDHGLALLGKKLGEDLGIGVIHRPGPVDKSEYKISTRGTELLANWNPKDSEKVLTPGKINATV